MKKNEFIIKPGYELLKPSVDEVTEIMGYKSGTSPSYIPDHILPLIEESVVNIEAAGCYRFLNVKEIKIATGTLETDYADILCGSKIAKQLKGSSIVALFIGTAGNRFDDWMRKRGSEDIMTEYYCSSIGSVIADKVADVIEELVLKHAVSLNMGITNRYSPGYCNWNIREQKMIFDLLPASETGVTLTPSFLMKPIKSVSGIIGIGSGLSAGAYMCEICGMTDCIVKRAKGY